MRHLIALLSILIAAAGCARNEGSSSAERVDLRILSWDGTQELVASHRGKVVVLDLWATTCTPCLREFPNLVALHRKRDPDRVVCISVSCDFAGMTDEPSASLRDEVLDMLRKLNATFENILLDVPAEELFTRLELASIPAVFVYGPDGMLARRFDNDEGSHGEDGFTYEKHIVPLVERLLAAR